MTKIALALLALLLAGCTANESLSPLSANGSADPCAGFAYTGDPACDLANTTTTTATTTTTTITTTTPLPFGGVAGTPDASTTKTFPPEENATTAAPSNETTQPSPPPTPTPSPTNVTPTKAPRKKGALQIATAPVDESGTQTRRAWGGWSAAPGARRAAATNFILVVNTANESDAQFRLTFDAASFAGESDPSFLVPITGNVEFATVELGQGELRRGAFSPADLSWAPGDLPTGITVTIHRPRGVALVVYRIVEFPQFLLEQQYSAPYHVEEVAS